MQAVYDIAGAVIAELDTPQKYGAVADGVTDCSTAIANLISNNLGGTVYFPDGVYAISEPIETYPTFTNGVNIIFHPSARVIALSAVEFLLDVGSLTEASNTYRGKKIIQGGIFDATNGLVTSAAVRINAQNIDFGYATILTSGCNGVVVGTENTSASTDAYLHNLYIRHTSAANTNNGILIYANDNNVESCRVYYYGVNINCIGGSLLFTDIHTLANGVYDADQVSLLISRDVYLTNYYADSEDTFIRTRPNTSPRIYMANCIYYSYKTNDVTIFDIANTAKIKINGFDVTCKANTHYIGVKMPYSSFGSTINPACFDVNGLWINSPEIMQDGDPLKGMRTNNKNTLFLPSELTTGSWYKIGTIAVNDTNRHCISIASDQGIMEIPVTVNCSSAGIISANTASGKIISTDSGVYQLGYKLNNAGFDSASAYPLVDVYIKRVSGGSRTLYRFDMESNLMARISPSGDYLDALSSVSVTPDIICAVNCDNETVGIAA